MPDTCEAIIGYYGVMPVEESLAGAWGCTEVAVVTLRGGCVHEHIKTKSYCAQHGRVDPPDAVWLCLTCAEAGHDCPMTSEVVR